VISITSTSGAAMSPMSAMLGDADDLNHLGVGVDLIDLTGHPRSAIPTGADDRDHLG
jgi:hypothetical protein